MLLRALSSRVQTLRRKRLYGDKEPHLPQAQRNTTSGARFARSPLCYRNSVRTRSIHEPQATTTRCLFLGRQPTNCSEAASQFPSCATMPIRQRSPTPIPEQHAGPPESRLRRGLNPDRPRLPSACTLPPPPPPQSGRASPDHRPPAPDDTAPRSSAQQLKPSARAPESKECQRK